MWNSINNFLNDDEGTTAVEYCVMVALIVTALILGITAAGGGTQQWWNNITGDFTTHGV